MSCKIDGLSFHGMIILQKLAASYFSMMGVLNSACALPEGTATIPKQKNYYSTVYIFCALLASLLVLSSGFGRYI